MKPTTRTILVAALAASAAWVIAGPLNPPAGPVAPTYKTLSEVEPRIALTAANTPGDADSVFRIISAGSYYLTGNVSVPVGKSGIEVAAASAQVDLNGFTISGVPGSLDGVALGSTPRVTVHDGVITNMAGAGVSAIGMHCTFRNLKVVFCGSDGLRAASFSDIERCTVSDSGGSGIIVTLSSTITDCISLSNAADAFQLGTDCSAFRCVARGSSGDGFSLQGEGALAEGCRAENCTGDGFLLSGATAQVLRSTAGSNGFGAGVGAGIHVTSPGCVVDDNSVFSNDTGILVDVANSGTVVVRNRARGNTTAEYTLPAGLLAGPIVTNANIAAGTNPHANYDQ